MYHERNSNLLANAKTLRRNMTKEERKLWYNCLKSSPLRFRRQEIIGNYIVDFFCSSIGLIIELDGSQHFTAQGHTKDESRDSFLSSHGYTVLRYSNEDINLRFDSVCEDIYNHLISKKD